MRTYRSKSKKFCERPYYSPEDVENICNEELKKYQLLPGSPEPVRIDRFIEKRFKITHSYKELPEGILGYTKFGPNGVEEIVISNELEENSKVSERRIRTTLAHEVGHGLFHAHLFIFGQQSAKSLFGDGLDESGLKILCRNDAIEGIQEGNKKNRYDGQWWEFQANLAIGALLLPRRLVEVVIAPLMEARGQLGSKILDYSDRDGAIKILSEIFDVNPIVGKIRLNALFPDEKNLQLTL